MGTAARVAIWTTNVSNYACEYSQGEEKEETDR